nr:hypothetical protein [Tanacetum cinerariifolium]
ALWINALRLVYVDGNVVSLEKVVAAAISLDTVVAAVVDVKFM